MQKYCYLLGILQECKITKATSKALKYEQNFYVLFWEEYEFKGLI